MISEFEQFVVMMNQVIHLFIRQLRIVELAMQNIVKYLTQGAWKNNNLTTEETALKLHSLVMDLPIRVKQPMRTST